MYVRYVHLLCLCFVGFSCARVSCKIRKLPLDIYCWPKFIYFLSYYIKDAVFNHMVKVFQEIRYQVDDKTTVSSYREVDLTPRINTDKVHFGNIFWSNWVLFYSFKFHRFKSVHLIQTRFESNPILTRIVIELGIILFQTLNLVKPVFPNFKSKFFGFIHLYHMIGLRKYKHTMKKYIFVLLI